MNMETDPMPAILVVDDEASFREGVKMVLGNQGYRVHTAMSGQEALEHIRRIHFDVILLDIYLPGMDGFQVMDELSSMSLNTYVILMTGHPSIDSAIEAVKRNAYYYLKKPIESGEIVKIVGNALRQRKLEQEKRLADEELEKAYGLLKEEMQERRQREIELRKAKETAEKASRAKSDFLANMSHELRTPLNHILGFTELIADKRLGDLNKTQEEYLHDALRSGRHLLSLIDDVLDMARIGAGTMTLDLSQVSIPEFVKWALAEFEEKARDQGLKIESEVGVIPATLIADEMKVKQILTNLLSNALKFSARGGSIRIAFRTVSAIVRAGMRKGDPEGLVVVQRILDSDEVLEEGCVRFLEISVSDSGQEAEPGDLARRFQPFEQLGGHSGRRRTGTGLGLSLTRELVELHGGRIWAESLGDGKGSLTRFILPLSPYGLRHED
jgi:signal transduction histidine kinase